PRRSWPEPPTAPRSPTPDPRSSRRPASVDDLGVRDHLGLAAEPEVHVHGLVLAVAAEQPERHREPATAAHPLLDHRPAEDDLATVDRIVLPLPLLEPVDEDLNRTPRSVRQPYPPPDLDALSHRGRLVRRDRSARRRNRSRSRSWPG